MLTIYLISVLIVMIFHIFNYLSNKDDLDILIDLYPFQTLFFLAFTLALSPIVLIGTTARFIRKL